MSWRNEWDSCHMYVDMDSENYVAYGMEIVSETIL